MRFKYTPLRESLYLGLREEKDSWYYNYHTKPITKEGEYFDTQRHESSFYTDYYNNTEEMDKRYQTKSEIVMMTPYEYFTRCAEINNTTPQREIQLTGQDEEVIKRLKQVILKYKVRFPMTFINYNARGNQGKGSQEGRHRMYTLGELFGWDKKYPVFVINETPEGRLSKQIDSLEDIKDKAWRRTKSFTYRDYDEFIEELGYLIEEQLSYDDYLPEGGVNFQIKGDYIDEGYILVDFDIVEFKIPTESINIREPDMVDEDEILDDMSLEDIEQYM